MRKNSFYGKLFYGLSVITLSLAISLVIIKFYPFNGGTYITNAADDIRKGKVERIYDVSFIMSKLRPRNMPTFLPCLVYRDISDAENIAMLFEASFIECIETDEYYCFVNEGSQIKVYKFWDYLEYETDVNAFNVTTPRIEGSVEKSAINNCANFIRDRFADFAYEQAEINANANGYEITFISKISNFSNLAFPTSAVTDAEGGVIRLGMYFMDYEKLAGTKIKSMEEAYYGLPIDFYRTETNGGIKLNKCMLVYHYQDSIIQPAYMFDGETTDGRAFRYFVNAAIYE